MRLPAEWGAGDLWRLENGAFLAMEMEHTFQSTRQHPAISELPDRNRTTEAHESMKITDVKTAKSKHKIDLFS
jgi:hypothetical protein